MQTYEVISNSQDQSDIRADAQVGSVYRGTAINIAREALKKLSLTGGYNKFDGLSIAPGYELFFETSGKGEHYQVDIQMAGGKDPNQPDPNETTEVSISSLPSKGRPTAGDYTGSSLNLGGFPDQPDVSFWGASGNIKYYFTDNSSQDRRFNVTDAFISKNANLTQANYAAQAQAYSAAAFASHVLSLPLDR